jgi:AcrR family transcriptional regulator
MTFGDIVARRRKCAMTTRAEMLAAARRRFLQESYENVGLREIARDVGVDVALVSRYFGNKEELFREVLQAGGEKKFRDDVAAADLPEYLLSLMAEKGQGADREHLDKVVIMLRSASSPAASQIIRECVRDDVLEPMTRLLGGPDAEARASLILSILMGTTILRSVMAVESMCDDCDEPAMRQRLLRLFEAAIAE